MSAEETRLMQNAAREKKNAQSATPKDMRYKIQDLLVYTPETFLKELESTLMRYKDLTLKFRK